MTVIVGVAMLLLAIRCALAFVREVNNDPGQRAGHRASLYLIVGVSLSVISGQIMT